MKQGVLSIYYQSFHVWIVLYMLDHSGQCPRTCSGKQVGVYTPSGLYLIHNLAKTGSNPTALAVKTYMLCSEDNHLI